MNRRRPHARHRLSRDAERLIWLARGLADSGSRQEDAYWETELNGLIAKLLQAGDDDALNLALDRLNEATPPTRAYEELADLIEAACEGSQAGDTARLFIALPVLAWSRYAIPTRAIPAATLDALRAQLGAHVLADGARVHFADYLFSPDQLPQGYAATRQLAAELWQAAAAGRDLKVPAAQLPESQTFVSDVRYLLGVVQAPAGAPLFRWNEVDGSREQALAAWREQGGANLQKLLTGCAYELLLPDAYFAAWRHADQETRPFSLKAAVAYLHTLFGVPVSHLRAAAAPYYDRGLVEWRVGFSVHGSDQVVHGVTWPLLGQDDESTDIAGQIEAILKEAGMSEVTFLDTRMPLEYCDDCGAPLFPSKEAENVHAELPEDMQEAPAHLH